MNINNNSNHSKRSLSKSNSNSSFASAHSQASSQFSAGSVSSHNSKKAGSGGDASISSSVELAIEDSEYATAQKAYASAQAQQEIKKIVKENAQEAAIMACDTVAVVTQIGVATLRSALQTLEKAVTSTTKKIKKQVKK